tara:strand:+ start:653 stop:850 length:198 start_codon:yes stop_codon:yes gene_type:complete
MGDMTTTREGKQMNFYEGVARIVMERYNVTTFDGLVDALGIETTWTRICRVMVAEKIFERDEYVA